jgi:hypothetical protein
VHAEQEQMLMARRQTLFQSCGETGLVRFDAVRQSIEVVERSRLKRLHGTHAERPGDGFGLPEPIGDGRACPRLRIWSERGRRSQPLAREPQRKAEAPGVESISRR